jgi:hypothetical protein
MVLLKTQLSTISFLTFCILGFALTAGGEAPALGGEAPDLGGGAPKLIIPSG